MEVLSRMFNNAVHHSDFSFHPRCSQLKITHLCFADYLMIYCKGNLRSVKVVKDVLEAFGNMSSLHFNPQKSSVYLGGVYDDIKSLICAEVGMGEGSLPTRYLGIPLHSRGLQIAEFHPLVSSLESKINNWANRRLSYAGRVLLVRSVLYSVLNFWIVVFLLPKGVVAATESLCRRFLWSRVAD